jgi:release factor glutamine methyltransferase
MDVRAALKQAIAQLREANVASFTLAAELLLLHTLSRDRTWLYAHPEEPISEADAQRLYSLLKRRAAGEPTQHLTGKQEFWGLEFEITPDVLIPRPETEHVIEVALDRLAVREVQEGRPPKNSGEGLLIADVGTGSGCISIALAKELPAAEIIATDISGTALAVARRNALRHAVNDRIRFVECNLLGGASISEITTSAVEVQHAASLPGSASTLDARQSRQFDLVVSNPPYVGRHEKDSVMPEVRDYEPEIALYGGEEGYELYAELIREAAFGLKAGGLLVLELGHNSLPAVGPLLDLPDWTNVAVTNDLAGIPRVIAAKRS